MPEAKSLPPVRPILAEHPSQFLLLERAVEDEYRPRMREELQRRVSDLAETTRTESPVCVPCGQTALFHAWNEDAAASATARAAASAATPSATIGLSATATAATISAISGHTGQPHGSTNCPSPSTPSTTNA